jgi:GTP-binding protein Era
MSEKSLKVALIGPPNVGKSTLINAIIGQKIAITTYKPQTTRKTTLGIVTDDTTQIVFADTPGIFQPRKNHKLEQVIVNNAIKTIAKVDILLFLVDAYLIEKILHNEVDNKILEKIAQYHNVMDIILTPKFNKQIIFIANKIDTIANTLENLSHEEIAIVYKTILNHDINNTEKKIIPVSAINSHNIQLLIDSIKPYSQDRNWEFPQDDCTDISERNLAQEITREQIYLLMRLEIPYSVTVDTDTWEENLDGSVTIHQSILVLKQSQKNMIIGVGGNIVKKIGERARLAITSAINRQVHLFLHVKVRQDWINYL